MKTSASGIHVPLLATLGASFTLFLGATAHADGGHRQLPVTLPQPPQLNWQPCLDSPTRDCATLTVPLDYADLSKGNIDLEAVRARASGNRVSTLVFHPGGPGLPGGSWIKDPDLSWLFSASLLESFDIISFDPRGAASGVACMSAAMQPLYWETNHLPRTDAEIGSLLALERQINEGCRDNNQPLVNHIDTASGVRDMEQLRRAAGLQTFTFLGRSHGTYVGYRYASLYPGRLRAMMLDAVSDRTISDEQHVEDNNVAYDRMWQDFKTWCQATSACQMHGQNIDSVFNLLRESARTSPIAAPNGNLYGYTTRPVNDWILTFTIQAVAGFGDIAFPLIDQIVSEALSGDASFARAVYDERTGVIRNGNGEYYPGDLTHRAITCLDTSWSRTLKTVADVKAFAARLKVGSRSFGESNAYQAAACFGYPIQPVETPPLPVSIVSPPPTLLIAGSKDASTPAKWAGHVAGQIAGSRLLTRDGYSHISYSKSACVRQHADEFLLNLTLPQAGTVCATDPPSMWWP